MSSIPDHTIGYGAVVLPHLNEFQGFFLVDNPLLHKEAVLMQMTSMMVNPQGVVGALQATIVEGVITRNWHLTGVAALALHGITKTKFFWIKATKTSGGTLTEMISLKAETVPDAQVEVYSLPLVNEMKARLMADTRKRKQ